jgi:hypothetical protein
MRSSTIRAAARIAGIAEQEKRKGEIPFETSPSACPILEDPVRQPDHNIVMPELIGTCEREPASPRRFAITSAVIAFSGCPSASSFLNSFAGHVAGSLDCLCLLSSSGRSLFR